MNNDYELIYLAKENNELAIEALLKKYYNYLYKVYLANIILHYMELYKKVDK